LSFFILSRKPKMSTQSSNSSKQIFCKKHPNYPIKFVCSYGSCIPSSPFICENCLKLDSQHIQTHKPFIYPYTEFLTLQTSKPSAKLLPLLTQILQEIEKKVSLYSQHCEGEVQEIDRDFATLFKTFFSVSETSKNFLKDHVKSEIKKVSEKLSSYKKTLKELVETDGGSSLAKKADFLVNMFTKDNEKSLEALSPEDLIPKLITKNQNSNKLRGDLVLLQTDIENMLQNKVKYKKNEQTKKLYDEIKQEFERSCKDMYRQFKAMIEGGDQNDLRRSIFTMKKSLLPTQTQTITIDLSLPNKTMRNSTAFDQRTSIITANEPNFKRINAFPEIKNPKVLDAISKFGGYNMKQEDSYFNNIQEQGPFQYEDGSVYVGHMKDNRRYGRGKLLFQDGAYYEGYWKDDAPYGYCRFIKANGDLYEGMCLNFKANGKGSFYCLDGYKYIGDFIDDMKEGNGEEFFANGLEIIGEYHQGVLQGNGTLKYPDGTLYKGEFNNYQLLGQGEMIYPNGEKYLGQINNGKKEGKGIYMWPDGRKYEGDFANDACHGNGIFWWADGLMYKGQWKDGVQHGSGVEMSDDGTTEKEGVWENGKWVKWSK